ncbi:hypothetical protein X975_23921, partial [Stegodyphus mimosarum]
MVTFQFHRPTAAVEESKMYDRQALPLQTLSTIPERSSMMGTSSSSFSAQQQASTAKQTDV